MRLNLRLSVFLTCLLLSACNSKTTEVPQDSIYADFDLAVTKHIEYDDARELATDRFLEVSVGLYSRSESDNDLFFKLEDGERPVLWDGVSEYDLIYNAGAFPNPNAPYGYYLWAWEGVDEIDMDADVFALRYYRLDGAVLESRVENATHPQLVLPEPGQQWNPSSETLPVAWEAGGPPVSSIQVSPTCLELGVQESEIGYLEFEVQDATQFLVDLREKEFYPSCDSESGWVAVVAEMIGDSDPAYDNKARTQLNVRTETTFVEHY